MTPAGLEWYNSIIYGFFISLFFALYILYSKALLNIVIGEVEDYYRITIVGFISSVIFFSLYGFFIGPLNALVITILSVSVPIIAVTGIYRESVGDFEEERFFKLKLILLWVFYELFVYLGLSFHQQLFEYVLKI